MATQRHVTNGVLQERIAQMDKKFTERDEVARSRLEKIEALLQEMREQQIQDAQAHREILSRIDSVATVVGEHKKILEGENHGMNKPGLVTIVKGHEEKIAQIKHDISVVKSAIHAPEKKFWGIMGRVVDAVVVALALMLLGVMTHKLGL